VGLSQSGAPFSISKQWFVFKNNGCRIRVSLYLRCIGAEPVLFARPNTLSDDGTVAFSGMDVSPDGKLLVINDALLAPTGMKFCDGHCFAKIAQ
jgi:hypothetical protein